MPPHQRTPQEAMQGMPGPSGMQAGQRQVIKPQNIFTKTSDDIRALNSSVLIISQKINALARNEKILGRNHLILNKKIKDLQDRAQEPQAMDLGPVQSELASINRRLSEMLEKLVRLESEVENIKQNYARHETVAEMKYVVDSINPLQFATLDQVKQLIEEHSSKKKT